MILMEILRYNILNKCTKNTSDQYIITFLYILLDILILSSFLPNSLPQAGYLASIIILSIIKNSILSYTTYKYGYYPSMIYTFILTIFPLTAPIYPMLGNYLTLVFTIIYSSIIFYNISKPVRKEDEETANNYKKSPSYYIERFLLVFIIIIIMLVSNNFKFSLTAIASDSMYPYIKKGDAVLIDKISDKQKEKLKEKDVIAFQEDGNVITHRIIKIEKDEENTYYITKGDNNSTKDVTKKTKDDIIGIVRIKIPLLGYPSVEISEIKNK
jgi:signal peptidase I